MGGGQDEDERFTLACRCQAKCKTSDVAFGNGTTPEDKQRHLQDC